MAEKVVSVALQAKVQGFVSGMQKAKASVDDLTKAAAPNKAAAFEKLADRAALAGVGVATAVGVAVKRFADFDQAMSAVQANSGATGASLDALRKQAIKLGADSQFSATEAAQGINELAKAGVDSADILQGGLKGSLDLAAAGQIGVADAAETAATALTQFKLSGSQVPHVADLLANAANKAQGGVGDMAAALKQAGLVAAATGLSIEETTAGLTAFASAGLIGSDAGTSFKTMLQRLSAPTAEAQDEMDKLGISAYDNQGNFIGLANVAGQLQKGMSDLTPEVRNAALATIFGTDAVRAANVLYEQGASGIRKWTNEVSEQGAAAKQAATLTNNLKGDIERLGGALDSVFISGGSGANSSLRGLVQGLTGFVDAVGKVPGPVLLAGGALTSLALLLPKGVLKYRAYRAELSAVGLSLDKISAKAPRTGKALETAAGAAKKAGLAFIAAAAASNFGTGSEDLGVNTLTKKLLDSSDAAKALADSWSEASVRAQGFDSPIRSLGDALDVALDPSKLQQIDDAGGKLFEVFGGKNLSDVQFAQQRLSELDQVLTGLVSTGNTDKAAALFGQFSTAAQNSGHSVDDLKSKLPQYTESLAAAATQSTLTGGAQSDLSDGMDKVKGSAEAAKKEVDNYLQSLQDAGLVVLDARSANREFEQALDDVTERLNKRKELQKELADAQRASADTDKNGKVSADESKAKADGIAKITKELADYSKGFDINTQAGRDNQAALDAVAKKALDLADARYQEKVQAGDLEGAEDAYRTSLTKSRDSLVKTGIQMGLTKTQAEKYADSILKIPAAKTTTVTFQTIGLDGLKAAQDTLHKLRDKNVTLTVGTVRVGNERVNAGQFATGGAVLGPGTATSDSIAALLSNGEHVWTAAEVSKLGGQGAMYALRAAVRSGNMPRFADGGAVASRFAPQQIVTSSRSESLGRQFVSGSLDMGNGLTGFVRAIVDEAMTRQPRADALRSM